MTSLRSTYVEDTYEGELALGDAQFFPPIRTVWQTPCSEWLPLNLKITFLLLPQHPHPLRPVLCLRSIVFISLHLKTKQLNE